MTYLLDTNVVSERSKQLPARQVIAWLAARSPEDVFVSAASVAEVRYGIERLPAGARRQALEAWFDATFAEGRERIIAIDFEIADTWGRLRRRAENERRTMSLMDALIAATAEARGLILVTRNVRDFEGWDGPTLNPWDQPNPAA